MTRWHIFVPLAFMLSATTACADIFKCSGPAGKVEYRDYACDGGPASGAKVDTRANTIGNGESLASIRERDEQLARRLDARRAADDRVLEREREARERAFYAERAYLEQQAGRYGDGAGALYWPAYVVPMQRSAKRPPPAAKPAPAIVTRRKLGWRDPFDVRLIGRWRSPRPGADEHLARSREALVALERT